MFSNKRKTEILTDLSASKTLIIFLIISIILKISTFIYTAKIGTSPSNLENSIITFLEQISNLLLSTTIIGIIYSIFQRRKFRDETIDVFEEAIRKSKNIDKAIISMRKGLMKKKVDLKNKLKKQKE